jgi:hypothetical protein
MEVRFWANSFQELPGQGAEGVGRKSRHPVVNLLGLPAKSLAKGLTSRRGAAVSIWWQSKDLNKRLAPIRHLSRSVLLAPLPDSVGENFGKVAN